MEREVCMREYTEKWFVEICALITGFAIGFVVNAFITGRKEPETAKEVSEAIETLRGDVVRLERAVKQNEKILHSELAIISCRGQ